MNKQTTQDFFAFLKGTDIEEDLFELLDEASQDAVKHVVMSNYSLDELRSYLEDNLDLNDA